MTTAGAYAHTNIALIKYWGKLPGPDNLPATGSISLTLNEFGTKTELSFIDNPHDVFMLDEKTVNDHSLIQVQTFLDKVRQLAKQKHHCLVRSNNNVPTSAGLASSASGFAALALAADKLFELNLNKKELSQLARQGSGSAARSIFDGLVHMHAGSANNKDCAYAEALNSDNLPALKMIVVQCSRRKKAISSREGMNHTAKTSPFYPSWLATHDHDLQSALKAIHAGDLRSLGMLTEHSTLKMHATMMAANPGFWYLEPLTLEVINLVKKLQKEGSDCYFTMDAGPHVKILCSASEAEMIAAEIKQIPKIVKIDIASPGPAAYLL
ncbi:MAG: diphosphomevalonate decarboxylase [bacterium]|nr:diphosphomevalonate decarboxylase [bacterium]